VHSRVLVIGGALRGPEALRKPPKLASSISSSSSPNPPPLEENVVEETIALPAPAPRSNYTPSAPAPSRNYSSASKPSNFVYPEFKVQQLEPSGDGSANILPIADLACQLSEITIGLRKDGKAIEFKRSVEQNGEPRAETQSFNLPYQVSGSTCSAQYFPDDRNGLLKIRLGKIISGQFPKGERSILQFRVPGAYSSNVEKVMIAVDQQPDNYRFYPGPSSKHDTDFTVIVNGALLEFRSTYSVEESDGGIKTITGKQSVQLPLAPTPDQIDVSGDTVTVWPARQSGGPVRVPDQDIRIVHG